MCQRLHLVDGANEEYQALSRREKGRSTYDCRDDKQGTSGRIAVNLQERYCICYEAPEPHRMRAGAGVFGQRHNLRDCARRSFLPEAHAVRVVRHRRRPIGEDPENNLRERLRIDRSFVRFEWIADAVPMSTESI